ncbi:uncharacterized protein MEPE_00200 [Melanopsichium pennsylvanicum]|uniref:Uncharacterized protein n=2 Tax=Melanopsichium pennsylvanicum TaxID=63383 RepID=A0AAJ5C2F0_9BASI|nr:putative protein [Melanopsichium pennsylvanicum 4]SNX81495.1 uncharacterized protein MEPE_00200 [Melanopsichium pennsylvanicum]
MTSSETARAIIFVSLALLGCLIRTYIRTANGEKEDDVHFWSSPFSQLKHAAAVSPHDTAAVLMHTLDPLASIDAHHPRSTNTSSGEVSQAVSVLHDQPPRFPAFLAETECSPSSYHAIPAASLDTVDRSEVDEAYEDWAAMHHARGVASEDAEASIDKLLQTRQLQKSMNVQTLPQLGTLGGSGASTPTIWTAHFPAAQLRPY